MAFSTGVFASDETPQRDTLVIKLKGRNSVRIIANSFDDLIKNKGVDLVKNYFITDLRAAFENENFPASSNMIYYFVRTSAKRRLKGEEADAPINIEEEKKRISEDLPAYHYIIYDIGMNTDIHLYLEDTSALEMLAGISLDNAIRDLAADKKSMNKSYRTTYQINDTGYFFMDRNHKNSRAIIFYADFGAVLIENRISPTITVDFSYIFMDKYGNEEGEVGFSSVPFVLADFDKGNFTNYFSGGILNAFFGTNLGPRNPFVGRVEGGLFVIGDGDKKNVYRGFDYGFCVHTRKVSYSFDIAAKSVNDKHSLWILSVRMPF